VIDSNGKQLLAFNRFSNCYNARPTGYCKLELGSSGSSSIDGSSPSSSEQKWAKVQRAFLTYKSIHGDLLVPNKFIIPKDDETWSSDLKGLRLGRQVARIRNQKRFSEHRLELEEMGFDFKPQSTGHFGWNKVQQALLTYKNIHGDLLVPQRNFIIPKEERWSCDLWDMQLGSVVGNIRNQNTYSKHRSELEEMGFNFETQSTGHGWDKVQKALLTYKDIHGDLLVLRSYIIPKDDERWSRELWGIRLGSVVSSIRNCLSYSDHRAELEEMGFDYEPLLSRWDKVQKALLAYKRIQGDLLVEKTFTVPTQDERWSSDIRGMKLGIHVCNIRNKNAYFDHRPELEEVGLDLDPRLSRWDKVERALLTYKKIHGDVLVRYRFVIPKDDAQWSSDLWDIKLGVEVKLIRNRNRYNDHRAELEEMGFDFKPQSFIHGTGWGKVKEALLAYKKIHGDLVMRVIYIIPKHDDRWPSDLWGMRLGRHVDNIRNIKTYSEHRAELVEMGFDFEPQRKLMMLIDEEPEFQHFMRR
jgi:hypothetical protein